MDAGREFVKKLRPAGCALFLVLFILVTVMLFTSKGAPVEGYEAQHESEYYAEHPDELKTELEDKLIPKLDIEWCEIEVSGGKVAVTAAEEDIYKIRPAFIYYYDAELFEFITRKAL